MSRTAISLHLSSSEQALLEKILRKRSIPAFQKERIQIVLFAASGQQNKDIAAQHGLERHRIGVWRNRWVKQHQDWQNSDESLRPVMNESLVLLWLADQKGRGRKESIVAEQRTKIAALSRETPEQNGLPITHWTLEHLAKRSIERGIVDRISQSTVRRILKKTTCRPTGSGTG